MSLCACISVVYLFSVKLIMTKFKLVLSTGSGHLVLWLLHDVTSEYPSRIVFFLLSLVIILFQFDFIWLKYGVLTLNAFLKKRVLFNLGFRFITHFQMATFWFGWLEIDLDRLILSERDGRPKVIIFLMFFCQQETNLLEFCLIQGNHYES